MVEQAQQRGTAEPAFRLAIVASHPIQYLCPWFRKLAEHPALEVTVLFCSEHGQKPTLDRDFNTVFEWDVPLTDGYRHEFLRNLHPRPGPYGFWNQLNPTLLTQIDRSRFDAVLVLGWGLASQWVTVASARSHRVPVLLRAESNLVPWERPPWKDRVRRVVLDALFRNVDAFLSIGSRNAALYASHGIPADRVFLAPYAVDNAFFAAQRALHEPRRAEHRAALGVDDDRPIIMTSGKLIPRKAPLDLVRAFAKVRSGRKARLVFLGDGPQRPDVEAEASRLGVADDVVITGFRGQLDMAPVFVAADLFAFPTLYETWGLVLNEAMLFGLPSACSSSVGATDDLLTPGRTGNLFPPGNWQAQAGVLEEMLADPAALRAMGDRASEQIQTWSLERGVQGVVQALERVAQAGGRGSR